ncbi:MAG: sugar ABC transporter permease [Clostridia bacterium]|nr:sugar ABC transporter permease [Clostridia bacterium]
MENEILEMEQPVAPQVHPPRILTRKTKRLIFYTIMVALPFLQFLIFYVYVNIDSILMAFKVTYFDMNEGIQERWSLIDNFKGVFYFLKNKNFQPIMNASKAYVISWCTSGTLSIFFSYYVYKKFMLSGIFKVFLYLPSMVSSVVLTLVYIKIMNNVVPDMMEKRSGVTVEPLLQATPENDPYYYILAYSLFFSLGGHILMYTGAMSGINDSVVEAGQLDGVNAFQEFWYITLPMIWPTFTTFTVTGLAGIFTNQLGLHTFYGDGAPEEVATLGYWVFVFTKKGSTINSEIKANNDNWDLKNQLLLSEISAVGFAIMAVILPVSMLLKKLMTKYGPSVD